ncbi:Hypp9356 [Branchiostoma lanceolatum]|uniref:Hypp9356 protein n=1 Tax=Branchiostoma lanceolatum TaxID=7740 RepID=A0A8S4MLL9_BRALA|nr:Hypp9356 [Branchiostoma lanceolatum]
MDTDRPYYYWSLHERYSEEERPSIDERPEGDDHVPRLHQLHIRSREYSSILAAGPSLEAMVTLPPPEVRTPVQAQAPAPTRPFDLIPSQEAMVTLPPPEVRTPVQAQAPAPTRPFDLIPSQEAMVTLPPPEVRTPVQAQAPAPTRPFDLIRGSTYRTDTVKPKLKAMGMDVDDSDTLVSSRSQEAESNVPSSRRLSFSKSEKEAQKLESILVEEGYYVRCQVEGADYVPYRQPITNPGAK